MVKSILAVALGLALIAPVGTVQASPVRHNTLTAHAKVLKIGKKHHKKHKRHHKKHGKKGAKTTAAIHHA